MATRGWDSFSLFFKRFLKDGNFLFVITLMKKDDTQAPSSIEEKLTIDLTDPEKARKAFIASEIFNRKY